MLHVLFRFWVSPPIPLKREYNLLNFNSQQLLSSNEPCIINLLVTKQNEKKNLIYLTLKQKFCDEKIWIEIFFILIRERSIGPNGQTQEAGGPKLLSADYNWEILLALCKPTALSYFWLSAQYAMCNPPSYKIQYMQHPFIRSITLLPPCCW